MVKPLDGIKVLDLTQYVAGPFCSMLLGDLGAEVIKIENVLGGDVYRTQGPNFINGESTSFLGVNRNKKSLALNLKDPKGVRIAHELAIQADVFLQNFKPGTAERLGLGYKALRSNNPSIIYASISGYGQTGPESHRGGYDLMAQGRSGIMDLTGTPGSLPVKVGVPIVDMGAAMYAVMGIVSALFEREKTGEGKSIDVALFDTAISWFSILALEYQATGKLPTKMGSASPLFAPYQAFRARDGYICVIGTGGKDHWERFCKVIGHEEWIEDSRFSTNSNRVANLDDLSKLIEDVLVTKSVSEWVVLLTEAGLACDPIQTIDQMLVDPSALARDMIVEVDHARAGRVKMIGNPIKFSGKSVKFNQLPPSKGENTIEILMKLGYTEDFINKLCNENVIFG